MRIVAGCAFGATVVGRLRVSGAPIFFLLQARRQPLESQMLGILVCALSSRDNGQAEPLLLHRGITIHARIRRSCDALGWCERLFPLITTSPQLKVCIAAKQSGHALK